MQVFEATIYHNDKTFEALSHMQYDLFCKSNRVGRTILSFAAILFGVANSESWWGILVIAYGCYLTTSTYASANHTAHKLAKQIRSAGIDFPASRYIFAEEGMQVISLPEDKDCDDFIAYSNFLQIGEDREYFYFFRDQYGGYMIPKSQLREEQDEFRSFIQNKSGLRFQKRMAPIMRLLKILKDRQNEPYHL